MMSATMAWAVTISPPPPQALHEPPGDQPAHRTGRPRDDRTDQEDHDRGQEQALAADQVPQSTVDGHGDRRRQDVGGDDPRHLLDARELSDDRGQRRTHDRLLERGEQDRHRQTGEHQPDPKPVDTRGTRRVGGLG
jgi:hypothetical protein